MVARYPAGWYGKVLVIVLLLAALAAGWSLSKTWPYNFAGRIVYRLLKRPVPVRTQDELRYMKQFLNAKRLIDEKEFGKAGPILEELRDEVSDKFIFFREIYLYLGYVYDVRGEFHAEESLYGELEKRNAAFSRFMFGLYYIGKGDLEKGRSFLSEALRLDDKSHRLGRKYRFIAVKTLKMPAGKKDGKK